MTREHNEDCKRLLKLMGIPYVDAPTEAEARKFSSLDFPFTVGLRSECAALVKDGKVFAIGTEDMDVCLIGSIILFFISLFNFQALTFGADVLVRHLTFSEARFVRY